MCLVVQSASDSVLDELNKPPSINTHTAYLEQEEEMDEEEGEGSREVYEPSPFSTRREMYSRKGGAQVRGVSLIVAGMWDWLDFMVTIN